MKTVFLTISEYAKKIGVSPQYVGRLIRDGKISKRSLKKKGKRYLVNPEKADLDRSENLGPIRRGKESKQTNETEKETLDKKTYNEARRVHEWEKARVKKLERKEKSGSLIDADEVRREADFAGRLVKQKVSSWPGRVSALVAAEPDPFKCEQILKKECNELLEEIAGGL